MDKRLLPHAVFPRVFTGADGKMRTELKALLKVDPPSPLSFPLRIPHRTSECAAASCFTLKALLKVDAPRRVRSSPAPPGADWGCGDTSPSTANVDLLERFMLTSWSGLGLRVNICRGGAGVASCCRHGSGVVSAGAERARVCHPPPLVLSGHAASLTPY